jgi:hypothetical protein
MRADAIRALLTAQPFRPFVLTLANGERLEAHNREFLFCPPGARTAYLVDRGGQTHIVDVALILKAEPRDPAVVDPPDPRRSGGGADE